MTSTMIAWACCAALLFTTGHTGVGYTVSHPGSWHRATETLSRITDPYELFTVATTPLYWRETDCEAFAGAAGHGMGSRDVVLTIWERTKSSGFPPRPLRFGPVTPAEIAGPGCGEPPGTEIHWRDFSAAGRHFHTLVRIGRDAPPEEAKRAWLILDHLRLSES